MSAVLASLAVLLVVFPVLVFVPGFVLIRRFDLPDALRPSVAVGVSLALLYAAAFVLYLAGGDRAAYVAIAVTVAAVAAFRRSDLLAFLRSPAVAPQVVHLGAFAAWLLLLTFAVRNFSGGQWAGDWIEHYERAVFFLGGVPLDKRFLGLWSLTARPPLNNLVASFFLGIAGTDFPSYQLVAVLLGSLQALAAASLWSVLANGGRARRATLVVLTALLALNPSVVENATYTWTRALTNFFVLEAGALYVYALREGSAAARRWGHLHLGLALVTHYSAVPFAAGAAVVELWLLARRRLALREALLGAALVSAPLAPWIAFAVDRFGVAGTFLANSTAEGSASLGPGAILARTAANLVNTLVPHPLRPVPAEWAQEWFWSRARDYAFLVYQVSLPALLGSAGAVAVAWLLGSAAVRRVRAGDRETPVVVAAFLAVVVVLGIASVAADDPFGLAHVCLQPLGIAGLVYLAAAWDGAPRWLRVAVGVGLAADAALGIVLHFWMQHLTLADVVALNPEHPAVGFPFVRSLVVKDQYGPSFVGDLPGAWAAAALCAVAAVALVTLAARRARRAEAPAHPADAPAGEPG